MSQNVMAKFQFAVLFFGVGNWYIWWQRISYFFLSFVFAVVIRVKILLILNFFQFVVSHLTGPKRIPKALEMLKKFNRLIELILICLDWNGFLNVKSWNGKLKWIVNNHYNASNFSLPDFCSIVVELAHMSKIFNVNFELMDGNAKRIE